MMNFHMYFKMNVMLYFLVLLCRFQPFCVSFNYITFNGNSRILFQGGQHVENSIGFCCFQMTLLYVLYILQHHNAVQTYNYKYLWCTISIPSFKDFILSNNWRFKILQIIDLHITELFLVFCHHINAGNSIIVIRNHESGLYLNPFSQEIFMKTVKLTFY